MTYREYSASGNYHVGTGNIITTLNFRVKLQGLHCLCLIQQSTSDLL